MFNTAKSKTDKRRWLIATTLPNKKTNLDGPNCSNQDQYSAIIRKIFKEGKKERSWGHLASKGESRRVKMGTRSGSNEKRRVQQTTVCTKITFQIQFTKKQPLLLSLLLLLIQSFRSPSSSSVRWLSRQSKLKFCHIQSKTSTRTLKNLCKIDSRSKNNLQKHENNFDVGGLGSRADFVTSSVHLKSLQKQQMS